MVFHGFGFHFFDLILCVFVIALVVGIVFLVRYIVKTNARPR
jgi:hypothetical protein